MSFVFLHCRDISTEFKIPVSFHPIDAGHQQALVSGIQFENPVGHPVLSEFGFDVLLFPGQTAGSIMLYPTNNGGLLLTGDSAMGTTADQAKAGMERLVRPSIETSLDDAELRRQWQFFNRPVATVLPFHGTGLLEYAEDKNIDLIVIGTRGRNKLSRLMLGSVASRVVTYSHCPVLLVK
ncbi:MAG: universal stress protein [Nitrososphaeraceae archaeon]